MSYFRHFPFVQDYIVGDKTYTGMNITIRTGFERSDMEDENLFLEYSVKDGESPEMIADRFYDDATLYWIITMFNNIFDISEDWPLSYYSLERYIDRVYGSEQNDIHHYESATTGAWVSSTHPEYDRIPVTNREYEIYVNDRKKTIKVPVPSVTDSLRKQHKAKIQQ